MSRVEEEEEKESKMERIGPRRQSKREGEEVNHVLFKWYSKAYICTI